jgi:hypothetical protein
MLHFSKLADIHRYNGFPMPENQLFSVYRRPTSTSLGDKEFTSDFYIIGFKKLKSGVIMYGRTKYDHDNGCMLFAKPRQIIQFKNLEYHEDSFIIFNRTGLSGKMVSKFNDALATYMISDLYAVCVCYNSSGESLHIHQLQVQRLCNTIEDRQPLAQNYRMSNQMVFIYKSRRYQAPHKSRAAMC